MDEDGLPLMGSGIDLTKVPAIQQKRTVAFLNQFVVHTVQFLNRFSTVCEEKLANLSLRIQQIETTLNILDAKLSSIPGLDDVRFEVSPLGVTNDSHSEATSEPSQNSTQDCGPQENEVSAENILTVAKDPRYARYLKMVQVTELQKEVEIEREVFHPLVHSSYGHTGWNCAHPKPGARNFFRVSHVGAGAQGLEPSSTAFPGHSRELDRKRSSWDQNWRPYGMPALQARAGPEGCCFFCCCCLFLFFEYVGWKGEFFVMFQSYTIH
ncbi:WASH complex subunit 3 isoform X2 [Lepus europaeus]|uniref:WASH complex subunit 3 isoform X2 n=1 Tax=Lepus europaeus TaxID=9983 RepID=UPI002B45A3F0|nr:WASH complex subunit 3 isoform X2 [Lepus europaeus]